MQPVILFRPSLAEKGEISAAEPYFYIHTSRATIPNGSLVIGRYSVLPYYNELATDLEYIDSQLVNSPHQHHFIADVGNWYDVLKDYTPETWRRVEDVPEDAFPIVVKGATNSKKFLWDTHMFAADRRAAVDVQCRLQEDSMIGDQWIYYRRYIPLKKLGQGFHGLPISHEFRIFVLHGKVVAKGFYWSNFADEFEDSILYDVPDSFLDEVISTIGDRASFYVVDVAKTATGKWIVVELNDGQMSGLSMINPYDLYENMYRVLFGKNP